MNVLQKILLALVFIGLLQAEEIAHYKLDGNALDSSKYERHGKMYGDAQATFDRHGHQNKALLFGVNERADNYYYQGGAVYIEGFQNANFNNNLSISLWIRKDSRSLQTNYAGPEDYQEIISSNQYGKWDFRLYTYRYTTIAATTYGENEKKGMYYNNGITLGTWHHLVYLIDKESHSLYIDGSLVHKKNDYLELFDKNLGLQISKPGSSNYFKGAIDDVRIFNHALSEKEVLDLFNDEYENSHDVQITSNVSKITSADKKLPYKVDITNLKSKNLKMWSTLKLPNGVNYAIHQAKKLKVKKGQSKVINGNLTLEKWFPVGEYKYTWYLANPKQKDGNIVLDSITFEKK